MPRPTGDQWVSLYRGLASVTPSEVTPNAVGLHWTTDPEVAYNFATSRDAEGWLHDDDYEDTPRFGTVLEAKVHKRNLIDPNSKEGQDMSDLLAIQAPEHPEQERTVRPGSRVHVLKMHHYDDDNPDNEQPSITNNPLKNRFKA